MIARLNAGGGGQTHLGRWDARANCWKPACGATANAWFEVTLPVTCVRCPDGPAPASQSVPAVPVSSTGGKETGEGDEDAQGAAEADWTEESRFADFREAYDYATIHFSAAIRAHAKVDRREAYQIWHTIQLGMEKIQRERSPLPDSETERPRRCPALTPESDLITEGRQCQQYEGHAFDHAWYGDNGHAYSLWAVTS